ncbi:VWA domain-containing protein [Micromonospora sp. WMMD1128]|uniref:VWA domain-containing protein n=1 Tax=Micromonospora sp. WMMD1128 TaxID=3015150 RepID=UPI00248BE5A7|nr:VWA domain-containing protein [Micromonospora sp. WMMD1128]WBB71318.1 VWA domain-containing protein [Micromonospora sp. WMMD1128]
MEHADGRPLAVTAHHAEYLPADGAVLDVIATVRGPEPAGDVRHDGLAEVILLDTSGSMGAPQAKMRAARQAGVAAIDALPDGVAFAVVAGTGAATMVFPGEERLAVADERTRAAARRALQSLSPHGGTAIGTWLRLARRLLATRPDAIGHAILLTDGRNETERPEDLRAAVGECEGHLTVDCRAIGSADGVHDWDAAELLGIAEALGANPVVPVEDLTGLGDEFRAVLTRALARRVANARLRVRTTELARVRFVKQVHPTIADLTGRGVPDGELATAYPIGAWSPHDHRDYHLGLEVDPLAAGTRRRIGWLSTDTDAGAATVEVPLTVEWTDDTLRNSEIHPSVAFYTGQQDYAAAFHSGLAAARAGRIGEAEERLGRAVALAHDAGKDADVRRIARIVDVHDAAAGLVRLKVDVDWRRAEPSRVAAHTTTRWGADGDERRPPTPSSPVAPWSHCGERQTGAYCQDCGAAHGADGPASERR